MKFFDIGFLNGTIDKNLYRLSLFTLLLNIVSTFYNLHVSPLYSEEPRRALVALEMLLNNNYIVTTILDETFYDHPPLWNIVLAGSIKIFGYNSFALRFPSAFSLLLTGILTYFMGKKYIDQKFGVLSALYYLVCADLYFYFSVTAEIDICSQEDVRTHYQIPFRIYETASYLELWRKEPVIKTDQCELPGYYIFNMDNLEGRKPLYEFIISNVNLALVKIE